jgi:competence protein ComEA
MKNVLSPRQFLVFVVLLLSCIGWQMPVNAETSGGDPAQVTAPVNINTASASEISAALKGIGEKRAEAIVNYREQNGAFSTLDDLLAIKGIGEKVLEKNADRITF